VKGFAAIDARLQRIEELLVGQARELLTPDQAAEALNVSRKTVNRMKADGRLRVVVFGRRWRVPRSEVHRLATPNETAKTRQLPAPPYDARAEYEKGMRRLGGRR
jgi:excisionase family DNA binding protein